MTDIVALAQDFYDSACGDAAMAALLKQHRRELLMAIAAGTKSGTIQTAAKNGASYTTRIDVNLNERREALRLACNALDSGVRPSRYARGIYPQS